MASSTCLGVHHSNLTLAFGGAPCRSPPPHLLRKERDEEDGFQNATEGFVLKAGKRQGCLVRRPLDHTTRSVVERRLFIWTPCDTWALWTPRIRSVASRYADHRPGSRQMLCQAWPLNGQEAVLDTQSGESVQSAYRDATDSKSHTLPKPLWGQIGDRGLESETKRGAAMCFESGHVSSWRPPLNHPFRCSIPLG